MDASIMTKAQLQIIELIAGIPLKQRREVVEHIQSQLLDETFYDRMTLEQRVHLEHGMAQADRGEGEEASIVMERLTRKLGVTAI